jgi:hypothetical protein
MLPRGTSEHGSRRQQGQGTKNQNPPVWFLMPRSLLRGYLLFSRIGLPPMKGGLRSKLVFGDHTDLIFKPTIDRNRWQCRIYTRESLTHPVSITPNI